MASDSLHQQGFTSNTRLVRPANRHYLGPGMPSSAHSMAVRRYLPWVAGIGIACLLAMAAESPRVAIAPPLLGVGPLLQRVEVAPEARIEIEVKVTAPVDATLLAADSDCRCLALDTPLPLRLPAGQAVALRLVVAGVQPGMKTMILRTTAGTAQTQVQVVTAGLGEGRDVLAGLLTTASERALSPWFIVHDLRGEVRNCGCSGGSLGGIEHLAALPKEVARLAPAVTARFLLSGDSDGATPGLGDVLADHGWSRDDQAVLVSADAATAVATPGVRVVIPSVPVALNHRRLLRPLLDGGMIVEVLLFAADGRAVEHVRLPVDRTLPSDTAILARFPQTLSSQVVAEVPSTACASCHVGAHATWSGSRHAHAWESLPVADRGDACVSCHSTPVRPGVIAPGVHCQACHTGADAHAAAGGGVKTTGTTD